MSASSQFLEVGGGLPHPRALWHRHRPGMQGECRVSAGGGGQQLLWGLGTWTEHPLSQGARCMAQGVQDLSLPLGT